MTNEEIMDMLTILMEDLYTFSYSIRRIQEVLSEREK